MAIETVPEWMAGLEDEDVAFIKKIPAGLRQPEGSGRAVRGHLSHGAPEAGQAHPKNTFERRYSGRPVCGARQEAGRGGQAGF